VGEFEAFAIGCKHDGVVAHDVSAAEGVHPDFAGGSGAEIAFAAVGHVVQIGGFRFFVEDVEEGAGGPGRSVDLVAVVHFGDFDVEGIVSEDGGGLASEVEEEVDAGGKIGGVDDGDGFGGVENGGFLVIGVSGGADDEGNLESEGGGEEVVGEDGEGEVNDGIGPGEGGGEIFAGVVGGVNGGRGLGLNGGGDGLAHAAGATGDGDFHGRRFRQEERFV